MRARRGISLLGCLRGEWCFLFVWQMKVGILEADDVLYRTLVFVEGEARMSKYEDAERGKQTRLDLIQRR